jgi:ribosomal protein L32
MAPAGRSAGSAAPWAAPPVHRRGGGWSRRRAARRASQALVTPRAIRARPDSGHLRLRHHVISDGLLPEAGHRRAPGRSRATAPAPGTSPRYSEASRNLAASLASQAAVAPANSNLFCELTRRRQGRLEAPVNMNEVLRQVVELARAPGGRPDYHFPARDGVGRPGADRPGHARSVRLGGGHRLRRAPPCHPGGGSSPASATGWSRATGSRSWPPSRSRRSSCCARCRQHSARR